MSQSLGPRRNKISLASRAGDRRSPLAWVGSILLHGGLIAGTLFTFAHTLDIADESPPSIPVDLVTIGEKTNIAPTARPAPQIKPQPVTAQPHNLNVQTPVIPQQDQAEPAPDESPSEPAIKPPVPTPVPQVRPQQTAQQAKPKPANDQFAALLNKLTAAPATTSNAKPGTRTVKGIGQMNAMTMDLVDALRNQISQCWTAPVGAPHPEQLIVEMEVFLNPDGSVAQPPQLTADSASAASGNPFMRAAADAAKRAIYVCAPYKLPADRYSLWRDITVTFDPRQMLGAD
jgi:outer membrane biosynthesis protein TonB